MVAGIIKFMLSTFIVIFLLIFSLCFKILIWKFKKPQNEYKFSFIIFNLVFVTFFIVNFFLNSIIFYHDWIHIILLYYSCIFAYLIAYTSIEGESPSIVIASAVYNYKDEGLDLLEIEKKITNEKFIYPRITSLVNNKLVYISENRLKISTKGNFTIKFMKLVKLYLGRKTKTS
jgi:hypothetical protein